MEQQKKVNFEPLSNEKAKEANNENVSIQGEAVYIGEVSHETVKKLKAESKVDKQQVVAENETRPVNNVQRDIGIALDIFVDEIAKRYQVSFASLIGIMTIKIHDLEHAAMKVASSQKR